MFVCLNLLLGVVSKSKLGDCITPLKSGWGKGKTQVCDPKANSVVLANLDSIHGCVNSRVTRRLAQELDVGLHSLSGYLGIVYVLGRKISFLLADTSEKARFRK